ncbi:DUF1523 family protein [Roseomonas sp. NAR14]|uniref:DUF1523 family protein n=1 Tax=Roseomonas acroporae TaxID=2937791 RepID=A0A9X1YD65_9PROT|nr:DUF1523 family protein [Roseomonas acroporae]MCK8787968.1 DUF1523 family protein [Roseomonas acroporae]
MPSRKRLIVILALLVLVALPAGLFLHYNLPRHDVVRIVSTDVKRVDLDGKPGGDTRDVFYIYAEDNETQRPRVYRNEDTRWGFPFYFKFNSADVQAVAASIAADRGTAVVTYYGWRVNMFSSFPNAVSVRRAPPDASPFPWFNTFFFIAVAVLAFLGWRALRRRRAARIG